MGKRSKLPKEKVVCDECKENIQGWFSVYILPMRNFICFSCYIKYVFARLPVLQWCNCHICLLCDLWNPSK